MRLAIVGGGAAGYFAAIAAASEAPSATVTILEAGGSPLQKVRISGGGRCNVTHNCFDPRDLIQAYPRGSKQLIGPMTRFGPRETVAWFTDHGVALKTEADGRMFPTTDRSATVVDCLERVAARAGVRVLTRTRVARIDRGASPASLFVLASTDGRESHYDRLLLAPGGGPQGHTLASSLGHTIVPGVPSLFSFAIVDPSDPRRPDPRLADLSGVSFERVEAALETEGSPVIRQTGPLLITHWGLSGPAILKLSAWGARLLAACHYRATLSVNFVPGQSRESVRQMLTSFRAGHARDRVHRGRPVPLPQRYWQRLVERVGIDPDAVWSQVSNATLTTLASELTEARFAVAGRGVFKDEFVTAGGVALDEIDFRTMESTLVPGVFFAGEVLDIDGLTGGFNFQSAWTTGWIAGSSLVR